MPEPLCSLCGDAGRRADGALVVFCTCAAATRAKEAETTRLVENALGGWSGFHGVMRAASLDSLKSILTNKAV
jgi:hypothetical protein